MTRRIALITGLVAVIVMLGVGGFYLRHLGTNQKPATTVWQPRPPATPAPSVALGASLRWPQVYEGDPLWIEVRIDRPRARQLFNQASRRREQKLPPQKDEAPALAIPPETWGSGVTIRLARVDRDGRSTRVFGDDASRFQLKPETEPSPYATVLPILSEVWLLPPALTAAMTPGDYTVEVKWRGDAFVDKALLDANGELAAPTIRYVVRAPANTAEQAEHLERLAYFEARQGNRARARQLGEEALRLDPDGFSPERADTYLLVARIALETNDRAAAERTYRALLAKLPPPRQNDLAVYVTEELARLRQ